jgi:hypothetical protein
MSKRLFSLAGGLAMTLALASFAAAQTPTQTTVTTQTTKTIQNADGTYTVIQYPADKEVIVNLSPGATLTGAKGMAHIMRHGDATRINLDLAGLPNDMSTVNLYAVDPTGAFSLIGPVTIANGTATQTFTTPLDKFMLVLSPNASLNTIAANDIFFRSAVPEGFAVIPVAQSGPQGGAAIGERVAATTTAAATNPYNVPMLNIPNFRRGTDTHIHINFAGELTGSRANVFVEPRKDGPTTIKMRFHELKDAPAGKVYVLWAVSPDNKFVRLGQIVNTGQRNEAQIQTETALQDFGLLITAEDETTSPAGPVIGTVIIDKQ